MDNSGMKYDDPELLKQVRRIIMSRLEIRYAAGYKEQKRLQQEYESQQCREEERHRLCVQDTEQDIRTWLEDPDMEIPPDINKHLTEATHNLAIEHYTTSLPIASIYISALHPDEEEAYIRCPEISVEEMTWLHLEVYLRKDDPPDIQE